MNASNGQSERIDVRISLFFKLDHLGPVNSLTRPVFYFYSVHFVYDEFS